MQVSRIPPSTAARFGLVSISETTRVVLPLKGVECEFSVSAGLVEVRMTQIFRHENRQPLDCEYLFPLPADASVFSCEADINGRIIRAAVRERNEAAQLAAQKKAEGRRVALVEAERENLFTLTLNNVQPDDLILVTLKYIQPLRVLADMPSVEIPFCPGIRYIPGNPLLRSNRGKGIVDDTGQVPDASRISPVRFDKEHPDAAFVEIRGTLDAGFVDAASIGSPSHKVISRPEGKTLTIRLSDKGEVPDRDFVLRWKELQPEGLAARAWIREVGQETYALLEIRAPKSVGIPVPMDFYFLVDRSGSMAGVKWEKAAVAVQSAVQGLAESDRAMVTLFNFQFNDFAEQPLPPGQLLADRNFRNLAQFQPDGGTELGPALRHVLELAATYSPDRAKSLILITDAQVGNETAILKIMEAAPDLPLHCFGVDVNLNDALLLALARQQRGTFHSLNPGDDVAKAVTDLARTIRHPVMTDLRLADGWEPAGAWLPPLYSGQIYCLSARTAAKDAMALSARNGDGSPAPIPVASRPASGDAPYLHWCKHRIQRYLTERRTAEAVALSVQSNLICPLTAFIAWDEAEKVAVATHALAQPVLMEVAGRRYKLHCMIERMAFSPRARTSSKAREQAVVYGSEPPVPLPPAPPAPGTVVAEIVQYLHSSGLSARENPFTPAQRRAAFEKVLEQVRTRLAHPEWKPLCDRILEWAFADPSAKDARRRSDQVALVLFRVEGQLSEISALRQEMLACLGELRRAFQATSEALDELKEMLNEEGVRSGALAERLARISASRRLPPARTIEAALAKIVQIEQDIQQQLLALPQSARCG